MTSLDQLPDDPAELKRLLADRQQEVGGYQARLRGLKEQYCKLKEQLWQALRLTFGRSSEAAPGQPPPGVVLCGIRDQATCSCTSAWNLSGSAKTRAPIVDEGDADGPVRPTMSHRSEAEESKPGHSSVRYRLFRPFVQVG
jgi:hypothetical protein